jgi:hypothetical protein
MPLAIAPMTCSRTPQCTYAPLVVGRRFEVGAHDHPLGHRIDEQVVDLGRDEDGARERLALDGPALVVVQHVAPAFGQLAGKDALELGALVRRQRRDARAPALALGVAAAARVAPDRQDVGGNLERRRRPAEVVARSSGVGGEQLRAVAAALALEPRDAARDGRPARDQRRSRVFRGGADRRRHGFEVVAIDLDDVPAGDAEAIGDVLADRQLGRAVVGDAVVVPEQSELAQAQVPCQRDHLLADPLLQAAVADERIGAVVDDIGAEARAQVRLGDRHAESIGDALAERAGRHFDAGAGIDLRMSLATRAEVAKGADLLDPHPLVPGQVQQRVEQHRAVAVRKHDAVAVRPGRVGGVELQMPRVERGRDLGHAERNALMPFAGANDGVDGEKADRVGDRLQWWC